MTNDKEGGIIQKNNRGGAVYGRKQKNEQRKNKKRKACWENTQECLPCLHMV